MLECHIPIDQALPLVCLCSLLSFLCGVGIGGNDLSANFAMVVGSGSLNMKPAIWYCVIFELLGAFFMGGRVSDTIRNGIVDSRLFAASPDLVIVGMLSATFSASMWLYISTVFGLPVSITHTVVGSVMGFAIFSVGSFEYVQAAGLRKIIVSWVIAPVISAAVTAVLFLALKKLVLDGRGSFARTASALGYCMLLSLLIDVGFVLIEQPPLLQRTLNERFPQPVPALILVVMAAGATVAASSWIFPHLVADAQQQVDFCWESDIVRTLPETPPEPQSRQLLPTTAATPAEESVEAVCAKDSVAGESMEQSGVFRIVSTEPTHHQLPDVKLVAATQLSPRRRARAFQRTEQQRHLVDSGASRTTTSRYGTLVVEDGANSPEQAADSDASLVTEVEGDKIAENMSPIRYGHVLVQHFNPRSEYLFTGLQVLAGAMSSFVHGAVAGANATATFIVAYETFSSHYLVPHGAAGVNDELSPRWSILPAMFGIAIGMFSLGARLMKTVGVELVTVTPARGWAMQVGGTFVTMVCTGMGIPVSLSQCQVGAAVGCGITDASGSTDGVSWVVVFKIVAGWLVTLLIGSITTGLVMRILAHYYCGMLFFH